MGSGQPFAIYIGHDSREAQCSYVAAHSILRRTSAPLEIHYIKHREQRESGLFRRPWRIDSETGEFVDAIDNKTFSTEFSHTRFLVPALMQYKGWALFMDADMIFMSDIKKLIALCDERFAAMCVKHVYPPRKDETKMDGRAQRYYSRKNWSSFMLINCGHPANKALTPAEVNFMTGRDLHALAWLDDTLIGALPYSYNFISGVSPNLPPECKGMPDVMHYTDGGPWFEECQSVPYAEWWTEEYEDWQANGQGNKYSYVPTVAHELAEVRKK